MQDWFDSYAQDLRAGDRRAVLARYHPDGAWIVRKGVPRLLDFGQLTQRYLEDWQPPISFEWQGLVLEPVGTGGLLAVGQFLWGRPAGTVERMSYTGLLLRHENSWRIRLEDENPAEAPAPGVS